ncbi:RNA polymerase sigma factor [Conexibacter woesei]|uniref:Sigma-70 region 4 type 2 n=1 Tax=Conexibacter woesei (strain DSM 14684 / CCUG 47730 / CIP 108061 / JCM 11494 / NBRC 100937 / ID131577) TaxID=469383 RepID=D3EZD8_CONWI|nr:sigma-70 region 4 domain-containing protein [Conexibacter woesei]ADB51903.1 Sigma-70 region 4 type 2 [Conexibacter woesei DSM 14684]
MSAAFETLPPDQRAVLQLILKQGRGYADLSGLLKIDEAAVRARAHAGLDALVPNGAGAALTPERRGQIADYLLGQQSDADRATTVQHLEDSRAARRWAGALHAELAPVASGELPQIPGAARNGATPPAAAAAPPAPADAPAPTDVAPSTPDADAGDDTDAAGAPAPEPAAPAASSTPPRAPRERSRTTAGGGPSRLGGMLLLGGVAVLVAVVLIVVLSNGGDDDGGSETPAAQTQQQRTTGDRAGQEPTVLQQVNLNPPGGGESPVGVAFIMVQDQRPVVAVQVQRIEPNGQADIYAAWLRARGSGRARFLGYVPNQVGRDGAFTVSSALPRDTARYDEVLVSRESITSRTTPSAPAQVVLQGTLRVNRNG